MEASNHTRQWQWEMRQLMYDAVAPCLLFGGLCSNALVLAVVVATATLRRATFALVVCSLAVADSAVLLTGCARHWLRKASFFHPGVDIQRVFGDVGCRLQEAALYTCITLSAWLTALLSAERLAAVVVARRLAVKRCLASSAGVGVCVVAMATGAAALHSHHWWTRRLRGARGCHTGDEHALWARYVMPRLDFVLSTILPFATILVCNAVVIATVARAGRRTLVAEVSSAFAARQRQREKRVTSMLLATTFAFVLLTCPVKLYLAIVKSALPQWAREDPYSPEYQSFRLVWTLVLMLQYANHAGNLLLYCCFNRNFRSCLLGLFRCRGGAGGSDTGD